MIEKVQNVTVIEKVRAFIEKARTLVPHITNDMLYDNGAIYYMNGNDGTDFDWNVNHKLCEFMVFAKNETGFIKVYVHKSGMMTLYIYEDFGMLPTHKFVPESYTWRDNYPYQHFEPEYMTSEEARIFACQMYQLTDKKGIYDSPIDKLDFSKDVRIYKKISA